MPTRMKKNNLSGLLALLVFAVFAVSVLMILLNGADIVQKVSARDRESFGRRTAAQYITTRIRQADTADGIDVRDGEVLVLSEEIDGYVYDTLVYCCDGYLREMFCERGMEQDPEFGEKILPLEEMRLSLSGNMLSADIAFADGSEEQLTFALRSERGVEA